MTDTSSPAATHSTANPAPVTVPPLPSPVVPSPVLNGSNNAVAQQSGQDDEDEPYTIKCICTFEDDDGHTVFCERCETWQHILCYYDGEDVPEVHNCADCEPRPLDSKLATELQRRRRDEQSDGGDRKSKRSGSKSHRKKAIAAKDNASNSSTTTTITTTTTTLVATGGAGDQTNGFSSHEKGGPPPAKKSKTSHRTSNSITSLTGLPPPLGSDGRKRATSASASAMSPTKTSLIPNIPLYSQEFLHLYDHDQANVDIPSNLFDNLKLATDLSSWVQDPAQLALVSNGRSANEVFMYLDRPLDPSQWPILSKQVMTDNSVEYDKRHPTWRFLTVENDVHKDEIIGEVKGKVGHFRDYCLDPNSRWQELRHPEPFVFFHPQLPIYIDSRKEGSQLRYVRRSCRPNVTMKTVITNNIEYHFCFVANQDISAKSEITTSWYLDPQMFPSNNGFVKQEGSNDGISDAAAISISNVLANFGGCACDSSRTCRLAKIDCRRPPKSAEPSSKQANGRRKKSKAKNTISPVNTGQANNSRAASETVKAQVDDDQGESRSRSTSNRPRSRDLTPTAHSPADPLGSMSGELSAREKRKIAAAEKKFEQLEHEQQQPPRKKKRSIGTSAGTTATTGASQSLQKPLRIDTTTAAHRFSTSPRKRSPASGAPGSKSQTQKKVSRSNTPMVGSPLRRPHYVDSEMQTEPDENDPDFIPPKPPRRTSFVPLKTRLFKRCHEDLLRLQQMANQTNASPGCINNNTTTTTPSIPDAHSAVTSSPLHTREDVDMKDADPPITPPKTAQHAMVPPSPASSTTAPSPVKKKLSLGDYMSRRGTMTLTTPTTEKPQPPLFSAGQGLSTPQPQQQQPQQGGNNGQTQNQNQDQSPMDKDKDKVMASVDRKGGLGGGGTTQDVVMQEAGADTSFAPFASAGGGVGVSSSLLASPTMMTPTAPTPTASLHGGNHGFNNNNVGATTTTPTDKKCFVHYFHVPPFFLSYRSDQAVTNEPTNTKHQTAELTPKGQKGQKGQKG
ncbi:PHD finger and SET domain-containing protein [Histoplasma capsulatum H143]|uniref:PHD finger and SET domain-containing protein n=1 Tax=Ajellomyces capsulatus (strain H143) TaxID=544712 RepID=C6H8E7_AJECH|nr:PHD finger and SET domain-containing protein [Histoplasma capsulatum H143]